ncbi:MAG: phytanoyl-CoA dioxygenase family protein [Planctomycetota bacterium]|nr:phytanoyl-CoA dioxygenase family protein [Planctomycetota bacterium]
MAERIEYRRRHEPVGALFPRAQGPAEALRFALPAERVAFFREHGYVAPIRVLDVAQLQALRDGMTRMTSPGYPRAGELIGLSKQAGEPTATPQMIYFQGAWLAEEAFHDILFHPAIAVPAAQLLEGGVRFFHDQVFFKPAKHGGVVAWHQDYSYWQRTAPIGHLTCFIALDDATLDNGCLHVIPGSQRWNLLPTVKLVGGDEDMEAIKQVLSPEQRAAFKPTPIQLKAGECSFHHPLTLHGSYANRSERPRRSFVLNFMKPDTKSASDKPLMPGAAVVPPGQVVQGDDFPLVLDKVQVAGIAG